MTDDELPAFIVKALDKKLISTWTRSKKMNVFNYPAESEKYLMADLEFSIQNGKIHIFDISYFELISVQKFLREFKSEDIVTLALFHLDEFA